MRILIAVHGFPPTHIAGAERQAERMAQWLNRHDHHVEVFAFEQLNDSHTRVETSVQDGLTVHRLFDDIKSGGNPFINLYDNPRVGTALRELLSQRSFDIVHIISGYLLGGQAVDAVKAAGLPVVISPMEFWFLCPRLNLMHLNGDLCIGPESDQKCMRCLMEDQRRWRLPAQVAPKLMSAFWDIAGELPFAQNMINAVTQRRKRLQATLDTADMIICNSQFIINKFAEFGYNTHHFVYIRQGLAVPPASKPVYRPVPETLRLGYIGQIKPHKGVDLLITAALRLLDAGYKITLDLWGADHEAPEYVHTLKNRTRAYAAVRWNGRYTGSQVWDVLSDMDALVIPSRWYENSPNVILEAFEMQVPVIVTALGGMAELVEHDKNGLLFQLNDVSDLERQLIRMIEDKDLLRRLRAGIPSVKTIDDEMIETVSLYHQLLDSKR